MTAFMSIGVRAEQHIFMHFCDRLDGIMAWYSPDARRKAKAWADRLYAAIA